MNPEKIGSLIFQLRKEKNLTQKQLGEKLELSDKTIYFLVIYKKMI